jgi:hypothetical protein
MEVFGMRHVSARCRLQVWHGSAIQAEDVIRLDLCPACEASLVAWIKKEPK